MNLFKFLTSLNIKTTIVGLIIGFAVMLAGGLTTESAFSQVNYPGSDFGGVPLTFDLQQKQENLNILEQQGTLDLFVRVQYLDVGIILGTLLFFTFLTLLIMKGFDNESIFYKLGLFATACFLLAPFMDALENISLLILISFRELSDLLWLSFLNSLFTLGKLGFFYIGWAVGSLLLIGLALNWLRSALDRQPISSK